MKLKAKTRAKLPLSQFGLPAERKYPMPDREHAGLAKAYATKEYGDGKLSLSQLGTIRAKADRKLKK